jgi:hypothetical protein
MVTTFHKKCENDKSNMTVSCFGSIHKLLLIHKICITGVVRLYCEFKIYEGPGMIQLPFLIGISAAAHYWRVRPGTQSKSLRH